MPCHQFSCSKVIFIEYPAPIPKKLRDFIKNAEDGIIIFSLGYTGFTPEDVPSNIIDAFVDAFAQFKQKVIMRFDEKLIEHVPDNVLVANWIPQQELLGKQKKNYSHCSIFHVLIVNTLEKFQLYTP